MGCKVVLIKMTRLFDRHRIMCLTLTSTAFKILEKESCHALGGLSNHVELDIFWLYVPYQRSDAMEDRHKGTDPKTQNMPENATKLSKSVSCMQSTKLAVYF